MMMMDLGKQKQEAKGRVNHAPTQLVSIHNHNNNDGDDLEASKLDGSEYCASQQSLDRNERKLNQIANSKEHVKFKSLLKFSMDFVGMKLLMMSCEDSKLSFRERFSNQLATCCSSGFVSRPPIELDLSADKERIRGQKLIANQQQNNNNDSDQYTMYLENSRTSLDYLPPKCNNSLEEIMRLARQRFSESFISRILSPKRAKVFLKKQRAILSLIDTLWYVGIIYLYIKQILVSVLMYNFAIAQESLNPQVRVGANRTKNCALKQDIFYNKTNGDYANFERLLFYEHFKELVGIPWHTLPGLCSLLYLVLGTYSLTASSMTFILLGSIDKYESHQVNFLLNPLGERRRLSKELWNMLGPLIESTRIYSKRFAKIDRSGERKEFTRAKQTSRLEQLEQFLTADICRPRPRPTLMKLSPSYYNAERKFNLARGVSFSRALVQIVAADLVEPMPVTGNRLIELRKKYLSFMKWLILSHFIGGSVVAGLFVTTEFNLRTQDHLDHLECRKFSPNAIPIERVTFLMPIENEQERNAYENYDGTLWSLMRLIFIIGPKLKVVVAFLESWLVYLASVIVISFYVELFINSYSDKIIWLNQILEMMDKFIVLMREKRALELRTRRQENLAYQSKTLKTLKNEALNSLILSYLQFELFRRQHKAYKTFSNIILLGFTLCWLEAMLGAYYIRANLKSADAKSLIVCVYLCVIAITSFQVCGAILSKKIERLMHKIHNLLACAAENSMHTNYAIELWRRQASNELDSRKFYALKIAGAHVTYSQLLTFNAYLVCFVLLMSGKNSPNLSIII